MADQSATNEKTETRRPERIHAKDVVESKGHAHRKRDLTAPHHKGGERKLEQRNYFAETKFAAKLDLPEAVRKLIHHVDARDGKPAYDHVKHMFVDVHLRDGVKPNEQGDILGMIEIKVRKIEPRSTDPFAKVNYYLYINVFPLPEGEKPKKVVTLFQFRRDEDSLEAVFVPHRDQKVVQAFIGVGPLPATT